MVSRSKASAMPSVSWFSPGVCAEITLHRVEHDVGHAAGSLIRGERIGGLRIHNGEERAVKGVLHPRLLDRASLVSTAESLVSLPAAAMVSTQPTGTGAGDWAGFGKVVPNRAAAVQPHGHCLAGIQHTGAAYTQKKINVPLGVLLQQLLGFGKQGVGPDSALHKVGDSALVQRGENGVQNTVRYNAAAAVQHQNPTASRRPGQPDPLP